MEECERMYAEFVVEKLQNAGGCLKFQHLTGHLSQLNEKARKMVGTKPSEIMRFLRGRKDLFIVESNGMISLQSSVFNENGNERSEESNDVFPMYLREEEGTVIKVLPNFGFIHSKKHKTKVYFPQASLAEGTQGQLLTDILDCGKKVLFNARKVDSKLEAKYQASRVWFPKKAENEVLHPEGFSKTRKTRDTGLYDPPKTEGIGKIQNVFENIGFIMIDNDPKNTVYFTKKDVRNVENVTDLTKVVKINDSVEFKAIRSMKKDAKSRWQATLVLVRGQPKPQPTFSRKMEKDVPGKIYPTAKGIVIKFGPSLEKVADADSCIFYLHGTKIEDVSWEFSDGDPVLLDVVSIKSSPYWKALLCWVGQRPNVVLKEDLGDFSCPEDEMDDIPESGSFTSKTSGVSSEKSYKSEASKNPRFCNTKSQNVYEKSAKQRYPRDTKKSNFHSVPSRSLSRSSRSSQHSQSSRKTFTGHAQDQRRFQGHNLKSQSHCQKYERDSGFGSSQKMNVRQPKKHNFTELQYSDEDCSNENELVGYKYDNLKEKKEPNKNKKYDSWGDTPYPGEEEEVESDDPSEILEDSASTISPSKFRKSSPVSDEKYESDDSNESDVRLNDSEDEASEDENPAVNKEDKSMFENPEDDVEGSSKKAEEEIQPYIRIFRNLHGKILKVYCKYGEIENTRLKRNISFFWTDVYYKKEPVANISEDLKEVLKVGQSISFDCFEILDDEGGLWNKIIMVWVDGKPKIKEITPQEFIKENQLVVSATEVLADEGEMSGDADKKPNVPRRKFLTAVDDDDSEDSSDSAPEPSDAAADRISKRTAPEFPLARRELSTESCDIDVDSLDQLSYKVELKKGIEKLLSHHKSSKSDTEIETMVSDVVDLVLNKYVSEESSNVKSSKENEFPAETPSKGDPTEASAKCSVSVTDSAVQTIITGEVISLSIFTHG